MRLISRFGPALDEDLDDGSHDAELTGAEVGDLTQQAEAQACAQELRRQVNAAMTADRLPLTTITASPNTTVWGHLSSGIGPLKTAITFACLASFCAYSPASRGQVTSPVGTGVTMRHCLHHSGKKSTNNGTPSSSWRWCPPRGADDVEVLPERRRYRKIRTPRGRRCPAGRGSR
jgi:hypothetical protein